MTTSHRPQLEARNGAKKDGSSTSIRHARLLPGHLKIKYRPRNSQVSKGNGSLDESQRKILELTDQEQRTLKLELNTITKAKVGDSKAKVQKESISESVTDGTKTNDEDLLKDLLKIRRNRDRCEMKSGDMRENDEEGAPSSSCSNWRKQSVFKRQKHSSKEAFTSSRNKNTNDSFNSNYHKKFMDQNVK
ncbi:LAMI_0H17348g1_1 [Lachancea mirantina]|uniref:LAMI_0H17348g1_1 n=1 Tax=Lachancea mirantina TaxID=1230905 RepID=A0A1G4KJI5_9SACH|nr:LAMI_0H17348g1_1 [Lachancea mirantina]